MNVSKIIVGTILIVLIPLVNGCVSLTRHSSNSPGYYNAYYEGKIEDIQFFKKLDYDAYSRPILSRPLKNRPTKNGAEYYALIIGAEKNPVGIFKFSVVGRNYTGLLYTINFSYSENGFDMGERIVEVVAKKAEPIYAADFVLLVGGATVMFTTLTGFTIDLVFNTTNLGFGLYNELTRENEIRLSYTRLRYDENRRLKTSTLFALGPKAAVPLAESQYWYDEDEKEPYKAIRRILAQEHKIAKAKESTLKK